MTLHAWTGGRHGRARPHRLTLAILVAALALPGGAGAQLAEPLEVSLERLERENADLNTRLTYARYMLDSDEPVGAFRALEPAIADHPDNRQAQHFFGVTAVRAAQRVASEQDSAAAHEFYQAAAQAFDLAFPSPISCADLEQLPGIEDLYREVGRADRLLHIHRRYAECLPDQAATWLLYGRELIAAGRLREAAAAFDSAAVRGESESAARVLARGGGEALESERFEEADELLKMAAGHASGEFRAEVVFVRGVAVFRQGQAIHNANTELDPGKAARALEFFRRAEALIVEGRNPSRDAFLENTRRFIEIQEAILRREG
jgi:tetratricopeptide (TPR) repeat protein